MLMINWRCKISEEHEITTSHLKIKYYLLIYYERE